MITHGRAPYLECSSKGDKRFSAFYAIVDGKSIEERYQAAKIFEGGVTGLSWREAKGKEATNQAQVRQLYTYLWKRYISEHLDLMDVLTEATGLSDVFGEPGHCCQATELWNIRNDCLIDSFSTHKDYEAALKEAEVSYTLAKKRIEYQLERLQKICPHPVSETEEISSVCGAEEFTTCLRCGADLPTP